MIANLFMHYALDLWLEREFPVAEFERFADDAVIHCVSEYQARKVLAALRERMKEVGLELHPDKTRIVYCTQSGRPASSEHTSFTFLGFTFRPRHVIRRRGTSPVLARDQQRRPEEDQRRGAVLAAAPAHGDDLSGYRPLDQPQGKRLDELLRDIPPLGAVSLLRRINTYLMRWLMNKYKSTGPGRKPSGPGQTRPQTGRGTSPTGTG